MALAERQEAPVIRYQPPVPGLCLLDTPSVLPGNLFKSCPHGPHDACTLARRTHRSTRLYFLAPTYCSLSILGHICLPLVDDTHMYMHFNGSPVFCQRVRLCFAYSRTYICNFLSP